MKQLLLIVILVAMLLPASATTAQEDEPNTWEWPEFGLSFEYPAEWNFSLSVEGFDFVLFAPADNEDGTRPYISFQSGNRSPEEDLVAIFTEIAGDKELTETEFAGVPAWQFEVLNQGQRTLYFGFGVGDDDLALLGFSAPEEEWEDHTPTFDMSQDTATIAPLNLDIAVVNKEMQTLYENEGLIGFGEPTAPVRMVEFMDFSCPACANYADSMDRLVEDYAVDGDIFVQLIVLDIIGDAPSRIAATAQVCATEMGYGWNAHEILFEMLFEGGREAFTVDNIVTTFEGADLDLDITAFEVCLNETDIEPFIGLNRSFAQAMEVNSTPSLLFGPTDGPDSELDFIRNAQGQPFTGGLPLLIVYDRLDTLLLMAEAKTE